jgi:hypothetical protein
MRLPTLLTPAQRVVHRLEDLARGFRSIALQPHDYSVSTSWDVISGASTAAVTLAAVVEGAALSGRTQRSHWSRDMQLKACAELYH